MENIKSLYTKETRIIDICDVDYKGRYLLSQIFNRFTLLATTNAKMLGMWSDEMMSQYGWVVAKQTLTLDQPIMLNDIITLSTLVDNGSFVAFPRYYFIYKDGQEIGRCSSIWTLLDIRKRRMVSPKRIGLTIPKVDHNIQLDTPQTIQVPIKLTKHSQRQVLYSDLDVNQHMNNTRYIQWALDIIDYKIHDNAFIHEISINYKKEIRPMEYVQLYVGHQDHHYYVEGHSLDETIYFVIEMKFRNI